MTPDDLYPHRWFDFWQLPGDPPGVYPKLEDWLRPDVAAAIDVETVAHYLSSAQRLWARTRTRPCLVCGQDFRPLSNCGRTDGLWTWNDDVVHLVQEHGLVVPAELQTRIERFGGDPPPVDCAQIPGLSFPPRWSPEHYYGKPEPGEEEEWIAQCREGRAMELPDEFV